MRVCTLICCWVSRIRNPIFFIHTQGDQSEVICFCLTVFQRFSLKVYMSLFYVKMNIFCDQSNIVLTWIFISAALKVPKSTEASTVTSITLRGKKFETIRTLYRAGCPTILNNLEKRVGDVTQKPMITLTDLQRYCLQMEEHSRRPSITAALNQPELHDRVSRQELKTLRLLEPRFSGLMESRRTFLALIHHVWRKPPHHLDCTIPTEKEGGTESSDQHLWRHLKDLQRRTSESSQIQRIQED